MRVDFRQSLALFPRAARVLARAGLLIASLFVKIGCSSHEIPCPDKTLVIVVNMDESVMGDELLVDVLQGEALLRHGSVPRPDHGSRGRIEVFLGDAYVPGTALRVTISPSTRGTMQGRSEARVRLTASCSQVEVTVTNTPPEPDWSCVGMIDTVTFRDVPLENANFHLVDVSNNPIPPATAEACSDLDTSCESPVWTGVSEAGVFTPSLMYSFAGFIQVDVPGQGYYPAMVDLIRGIGQMNARPVIVLVKPGILQGLATQAGEPLLLTERGHLTLATFDCRGYRIGGVSFSFTLTGPVDGVQPQLYVLANNWYPNKLLDTTDSTGTAFIANLPPGLVQVTATHKTSGTILTRFFARVVAGTMTYVAVEPGDPQVPQ